MKRQSTIALAISILAILNAASVLYADRNTSSWNRAAYWDGRYPSAWAGGGEVTRDALEYTGYKILDADRLKAWMDARISDGTPSVVVFCHDIAPDTVVESMSSRCTLRRYLDAGGKIVWYADIPMYYQGHVDGTRTDYGVNGPINILGFNAASGPWDTQDDVAFTVSGVNWGLTETWQSERPTSSSGLRVLAEDNRGYAAAWVKHYVQGDSYRGFVRLYDQAGEPNINDVRRVAEYPHVPEPIVFDNEAENEDDIVGVFFYPWYENPNTSGRWTHWEGGGCSPPTTWAACYLPNYPDSSWNPSVQLYDSKDTEVLRWQDRAMARAGVDIAIASWWGIGGYEDAGLARAIRTCKSVQWCIYYEMDAYGDPPAQKIYDDIKYVVDTYGPTRNYARVDGKWLVLVYGAGGEETADRWRQAKTLLAGNGYHVYLNGATSIGKQPWDAVHSYRPVVYQGYTETLPNADDSAWISPGFWGYGDSPVLERSLSEFKSAWNNIVEKKDSYRFVLIETWNEWHEGTQIEPGQEIVPDPRGYYPAGYDYGYDFIDAIALAAVNELHWKSSGHRPVPPVRLEAEEMIWDDDQAVLEESPTECRITEPDIRIGSSILAPNPGDAVFSVRARAAIRGIGRSSNGPELMLYLDDIEVRQWTIDSSVYEDHSTTALVPKGIHKLELAMADEPVGADWDIVVDFVDVNVVWTEDPPHEGFETGDLSEFDWISYGDENWTVTSDERNSGTYSAQAGSIDDNQTTTLEITLDCIPGDVSFYCKVSCESYWDSLKFYINGVEQDKWSGEEDWTQASFPVTEGRRTFRWAYSKDESSSDGNDTAWIDDVVFPVRSN
jgi:hypothetical protein